MASSFITAVSRFPRPGPYRIFRRISTSPTSFREKKAAPCQPSHDSDKYNYNTSVSFDETPDCKHLDYPLVTANDLKTARDPPTRVKLLVRDFIEDSLYNPQYGYFSQQATIFAPADGAFNFTALRDSVEFQDEVAKRYGQYGHGSHDGPGRQLWHTPTELFKVYSTLKCILRGSIIVNSLGMARPSQDASFQNTSSNIFLTRTSSSMRLGLETAH
jgi:hypothetical protein